MKTYEIEGTKDEEMTIKCLRCGKVSYNINDIKNKYCGNCHIFHEDEEEN